MADAAAGRGGSCEGGRAEEMGGGLASGGPGLFFTEGEVCRLASGCKISPVRAGEAACRRG